MRSIPSSWAVVAPRTATGSCGGSVEIVALGDGGGEDREEVERCGLDGEAVGIDRGDVGSAEGVGAADRPGALHLLHTADTTCHARRRGRELGGAAGEALPAADGDKRWLSEGFW
jgi:hypothetical protein